MPFILAIDFDDTLFEGSFPDIGEPKQDEIGRASCRERV